MRWGKGERESERAREGGIERFLCWRLLGGSFAA